MAISDIQSLMHEILVDDLPSTFTEGDDLTSVLMRAEKIEANTRAVVFNLKINPGGDFKGMDFDGGALPVGNRFQTAKPTVSSIGMVLGFNCNWLVDWATKNGKQAIRPVLREQVANTAATWKLWMESLLNASSNDGVLGRFKTIASAPTYTLESAAAGDTYSDGGYLLQPGGRYDIYDTTLVTLRAGGPYRVDPDGGLATNVVPPTATFTATVTDDVIGDKIVAQSLVNASINSLWTHINGGTSGTWQSLNRTKIYARAQRVDGASQKLDAPILRELFHAILKFKGNKNSTAGLRPYMGYEQYRNYQNAAQDISQMILGGANSSSAVNKNFDLMVGEGKIEGRTILIGNHCDPTKVGLFDPKQFRWIQVKAPTMLENPEGGGYFFNIHDTTLGSPTASKSWYFGGHCNLAAVDVTGMGVVDTLAQP